MDPNKTDAERLREVAVALSQVEPDILQMMYDSSREMKKVDVIVNFNQKSRDLFALLNEVSRKTGRDHGLAGYVAMFESALRINRNLPLEKFTLVILKYAPDIYSEREDRFLSMAVPDAEVSVGNAYGVIRSEAFRDIWLSSSKEHQKRIKSCVIDMTSNAHIYFYQTIEG